MNKPTDLLTKFSDSDSSGAFSILFTLALTLTLFLSSCVPARRAMYFADIAKEEHPIDSMALENAKRVYPGDRLMVQIITSDIEANTLLNSGMMGGMQGQGQGGGGGGYLIDPDGYIEIPTIGGIKVAGHTPTEIREIVRNEVSRLYKEVTVICTMNGRVTILEKGGTGGGMIIPMMNERLTILEALAGTSAATLKLDKAWIVRETGAKREMAVVDLNSKTIFQSPYYYLRNKDLIYIEPYRATRFLEANAPARNLVSIVSGFSGLVLGLLAFFKYSKY